MTLHNLPQCFCTCREVLRLLFGSFRDSESILGTSTPSLTATRSGRMQSGLSLHSPRTTFRNFRSLMCTIFYVLIVYFQLTAYCVCAGREPQLSDFPPWVQLTTNFSFEGPRWKQRAAIGIPVSVHAGYETQQWVAFRSGLLLLADIEKASVRVMNDGNETRSLVGICQDSRGPSTLYATGGQSGLLYAYDNSGNLQYVYNISNTLTRPVFLSSCIQTRYHLLVLDSLNPHLYSLPLVDSSTPDRGMPAPTDAFEAQAFDGFQHNLSGDWTHVAGSYNAFGVEWSNDFNDTAYVINWHTGILYTIQLTPDSVNTYAKRVSVSGAVFQFPGAVSLKFDSRNERILYITIPHLNAIAILQISSDDRHSAQFITYRTHQLSRGVVSVSEYGDYLYMISANRIDGDKYFTLVQTSRYFANANHVDDETGDHTPEPLYAAPSPSVFANRSEILAAIVATPFPVENSDEPSDNATFSPYPVGIPAPSESGTGSSNPDVNSSDDSSVVSSGSTSPVSDSSNSGDGSSHETGTVFGDIEPDNTTSIEGGISKRECFPASAMVTMMNGEQVRMDKVEIGDSILSHWDKNGTPVYTKVVMFTHRLPRVYVKLVKITTGTGDSVLLSRGHFVPVYRIQNPESVQSGLSVMRNSARNERQELIASKDVRPGYLVVSKSGQLVRITNVEFDAWDHGLFNVQTMSGSVVVHNIVMSTYTTAVRVSTAHALLMPLRLLSYLTEKWCGVHCGSNTRFCVPSQPNFI